MSERKVYHVVKDDEGWEVKQEGKTIPLSRHRTKDEAIEAGKKLAESSGLGQVKIHTEIGGIQEERTYGKDPRKTPG